MRLGVVVVLMSLDVEKGEACFCVAHGKIEPFARWQFFHHQLVKGRAQGSRDALGWGRALRYQHHRTLLRAAQEIVKHKDAEERILRDKKTQLGKDSRGGFLQFSARLCASAEPVQIDLHRRASVLDD